MERHTAEKLRTKEIVVPDPRRVRLLYEAGRTAPTVVEPCVQFREGIYDIEHIGGYTYFGGRNTLMRHIRSIGRFCSIAGDIVAGQVEHPTTLLSTASCLYGDWRKDWPSMTPFYEKNEAEVKAAIAATGKLLRPKSKKIVIGNDVWIGYGALISRGVTIGDGAIVASRAVVTKDVPPYAIVGGTPAKVLRMRFSDEVISRLLRLQWWNYGTAALEGASQSDIAAGLDVIEQNIQNGAQKWLPEVALLPPGGAVYTAMHPKLPEYTPACAEEVTLKPTPDSAAKGPNA